MAIHPAPPTSVSPGDPARRDRQAVARAADARERPTDHDVDVAVARDADPHRVGRRRRLAHRAHVQAPARAREVEGDGRRQRPRPVDERRLVEEDRAEHPEVAEAEDVERAELVRGRQVGEVELACRSTPTARARRRRSSARGPDTIWLARSVTVRNAWIAAIAAPAAPAATTCGDEHDGVRAVERAASPRSRPPRRTASSPRRRG